MKTEKFGLDVIGSAGVDTVIDTVVEPIPVRPGDMIVANVGRTKSRELRKLIRADEIGEKIIKGVYLGEAVEVEIEVDRLNVLANIGPKPLAGWVYGLSVAALMQVTELGGTKIIDRADVPAGMHFEIDRVLKEFTHAVFRHIEFSIEIHPPYGKRLGSYATMKRKSTADVMTLHTTCFDGPMGNIIDETMIHEAGHGIWNHLVPHQIRAEFIKHYADSIKITPTELKDIRKTAEEFDAWEGTVATFAKQNKTHGKGVFRKMIRWIKEVHKLSTDDLEKLRFGGLKVAKYFPSHEIVMSAVQPVITQYGTTNAIEFFCEGIAYYHLNKPMPKAVRETFDHLQVWLNNIK